MKVPSHLTIRNLPSDLPVALRREKRRRGVSLSRTVIVARALAVILEVPTFEFRSSN